MKEMNLTRLLKSCCVTIPDKVQDALFDYLMELDVDLNTLNVDNLYVNGVQYLEDDEGVDYTEDYHLLVKDEDGGYYI